MKAAVGTAGALRVLGGAGEPGEVAGPQCQPPGPGALAPTAEHAQQFTGLQALLLSRGLHVKPHVHEELGHVHLLPRELVPDGGAGGVAVRPRAAVHQVDGAALHGGFAGLVAVVQASVPAVQRPGQRGPLHLDVCPVATHTNPGGQSVCPKQAAAGGGLGLNSGHTAGCGRGTDSPRKPLHGAGKAGGQWVGAGLGVQSESRGHHLSRACGH